MLHLTFILWIVNLSFPNHDFVFEGGTHALNYIIWFLKIKLSEGEKSVLVSSNTLKRLTFGVNKCMILKFNKSGSVLFVKRNIQ